MTHGGSRAFVAVGLLGAAVGITVVAVLVWWRDQSALVALSVALALVLCVLAEGSYRVWDATARELDGAQNELKRQKERDNLLDNLGRRHTSGGHYKPIGMSLLKVEHGDDYYEKELEKARTGAKKWARDTERFIRDKVGWDEAAIFDSDEGLPSHYHGPEHYLATEADIVNYISRRLLRLEEIMIRLRGRD